MGESVLYVMLDDVTVGTITPLVNADFVFQYDPSWLTSPDVFPISQSLPLQDAPFTKEISAAFFSNLLPEGFLRLSITRQLGISPDNDFELLKNIGGECAGALSIVPEKDNNERVTGAFEYSPLPIDELLKIEKQGQLFSSFAYRNHKRLSLAGAQDKLPVLYRNSEIFIPENNAPSSHILKFQSRDFKFVPENEFITTKLAGEIGLPVVHEELFITNKKKSCMIERYDRIRDVTGRILRLHQEDMCQAMSISFKRKYEEEGGPTFARCFNVLSQVSSNPLSDCDALIRWQISNLLIGNSDGHAKNLSLIYRRDGTVRLAPFYDLVNTAVYPNLDRSLAMSIGGCADHGTINKENWHVFAKDIGIQYPYLVKVIRELSEKITEASDTVFNTFTAQYGYCPITERIKTVIQKRIRRTVTLLD